MSATNRSDVRAPSDFYPTPKYTVKRLLDKVKLPTAGLWLEPGAGNGAIIRAVNESLAPTCRPIWTAVESREECREPLREAGASIIAIGDFLTWPPTLPVRFDVAFGNPPFSLAMPFIERCMELACQTFLLLRINFLGSQKRCAFMREHTPNVYVLPNRPSFTGHGTDATEYAWFEFASHRKTDGRLVVLDETPAIERRAA